MTILGDNEAAHFVRQGVAVTLFFFSKIRGNFVKITAISKRLAHELSLLSWTSRPLFAHFSISIRVWI